MKSTKEIPSLAALRKRVAKLEDRANRLGHFAKHTGDILFRLAKFHSPAQSDETLLLMPPPLANEALTPEKANEALALTLANEALVLALALGVDVAQEQAGAAPAEETPAPARKSVRR